MMNRFILQCDLVVFVIGRKKNLFDEKSEAMVHFILIEVEVVLWTCIPYRKIINVQTCYYYS